MNCPDILFVSRGKRHRKEETTEKPTETERLKSGRKRFVRVQPMERHFSWECDTKERPLCDKGALNVLQR